MAEQRKDTASRREKRQDEEIRMAEQRINTASRREKRKDEERRTAEQRKDTASRKEKRQDEERRTAEQKINTGSRKRKREQDIEYREQEKVRDASYKRSARKTNQGYDMLEDDNLSAAEIAKYGRDLGECIAKFEKAIELGPVYICIVCHQTWFRHSVSNVDNLKLVKEEIKKQAYTDIKSFDDHQWICNTCKNNLLDDKIPTISVVNGFKYPDKPECLHLNVLEERAVSPRTPFMVLNQLPSGRQYQLRGSWVMVVCDIVPLVHSLPRFFNDHETMPLKMKRKMLYKTNYLIMNVRPRLIWKAELWLMQNGSLWKDQNIPINIKYLEKMLDKIIEEEKQEEVFLSQENMDSMDSSENRASSINQVRDDQEPPLKKIRRSDEEAASNQDNGNDYVIPVNYELFDENVYKQFSRNCLSMSYEGINIEKENTSINNSRKYVSESVEGEDSDDDNFNEIEHEDNNAAVCHTMLDEKEFDRYRPITFAPGEGNHPVSFFQDKDCEELSFPTVYCGERFNPTNKDTKKLISYADRCKWELRAFDGRARTNIPQLFFKLRKLQMKQVIDKGQFAMNRVQTKGRKYTAKDVRRDSDQQEIAKLDEGYRIFKSLRNSPPYLQAASKDIFAMVRQLSVPTWFISLSAADTKWKSLIRSLGLLIDKKDYIEMLDNDTMPYELVTRLVREDPVTCARFFDHRVKRFINDVVLSPHDPIHRIVDFVYRIEFQHRGSPHIHALLWAKNAPDIQTSSKEEIEQFVDRYVSVSLDVDEETLKYIMYQKHKHSNSCKKRKKKKTICRFGHPVPPFPKTILLQPYTDDTEGEIYKKLFDKIKENLENMKDGKDMSFLQFLTELNCTYDEYELAIRSSLKNPKIFLKRNLREIRINPYMKNLVNVWQANHDIQYVLDPYACVNYICDYIMKSAKGMSLLLREAHKEVKKGNDSLKKQISFMGNKFLNAVETSAQEAAYFILQMPIIQKSRSVIFINTCHRDERVRVLKQEEMLKELKDEDTDIFQPNQITRYGMRPKQLQDWCLADYVAYLEYIPPKHEEEKDPYADNYEDDEENITDSEEDESRLVIGQKIKIKFRNGGVLRSRLKSKIIRYVRYREDIDPDNYYREHLMLFIPFKNEECIIGDSNSYHEQYNKNKNKILEKKAMYDHNSKDIDIAVQRLQDESMQQSDDEDAMAEIAPNNVQMEADDEERGVIVSDDFTPFNLERPRSHTEVDIGHAIGAGLNIQDDFLKGCWPDEDYVKHMRKLNFKQREIFLHIYHHILTEDKPLFIFLSGSAGTGKSVLVHALDQSLRRHFKSQLHADLNPNKVHVLKLAMTGSAAYNIDGQTVHHALAIPVQESNENKLAELTPQKSNIYYNKYETLNTIMIDEVSLVHSFMFNCINNRLQQFLKARDRLMGNRNMILIGDLFQLKPVGGLSIFKQSDKLYQIFGPNLFRENFKMYELTEIMRQKEDKSYAELLNRLREGEHTKEDIELLKTRIIKPNDVNYPIDAPHLFAYREEVAKHNLEVHTRLKGDKTEVKSINAVISDVTKEVKDRALLKLKTVQKYAKHDNTGGLPYILRLGIGLEYDYTINKDVEDGLCNGSTCILREIKYRKDGRPYLLWVEFEDEKVGRSKRATYRDKFKMNHTNSKFTPIEAVNKVFKVDKVMMSRTQFPLINAAARTIDRSQGKTLKKMVVKMGSRAKAHSHYTAFSRVTSLENLYILDLQEDKITVDPEVKEEMRRLRHFENEIQLCYTPVYKMSPLKPRIVFNNIQSLHLHYQDIIVDPNFSAADVICLAETRLSTRDKSEDYSLHNFLPIIRNDQQALHEMRPHHGLGIYLRNTYDYEIISHYNSKGLEYSIIRIMPLDDGTNRDVMQIVVLYKAPKTAKETLINALVEIRNKTKTSIPLLVVGDFNVDADENATDIKLFEEILLCKQQKTKCTTYKNTTIDLVFSDFKTTTGIIESMIPNAYHKMVTIQQTSVSIEEI